MDAQMVVGAPRPRLRPLVARYTGYRVRTPAGVHHGLPSRYLTLIVTIEGTVDMDSGSFSTLASGLFGGPVFISHDGFQYGIQADLTPLGARALFGMPAGELAATTVSLDALLGSAAFEVRERLQAATTWADRFAHLDQVLERVAVPASFPVPEVLWAWQRLVTSAGAAGVGELAAEVGWSRQHLTSLFRKEFGLTPKVAGRVLRFEVAHRMLRGERRPSLAEVAASCGYADQAHFTREWHALAGATPTAWMAEELPFVQDAPHPDVAS